MALSKQRVNNDWLAFNLIVQFHPTIAWLCLLLSAPYVGVYRGGYTCTTLIYSLVVYFRRVSIFFIFLFIFTSLCTSTTSSILSQCNLSSALRLYEPFLRPSFQSYHSYLALQLISKPIYCQSRFVEWLANRISRYPLRNLTVYANPIPPASGTQVAC